MKISISDLQLLMAWLSKNSADTSITVLVQESGLEILATDSSRQLARITIFSADSCKKAVLTVNQLLEQF